MEANVRILAAASIAPIAWGSGYYVTATYLPDRPLFGAVVRALPFGLMLLAFRPGLLKGEWWWRTALLGLVNFSAFFALIFVVADRLPGGLAATLMATSPIAVMLIAWALAKERPRAASLAAGVVGIVGVALIVLRGGVSADPIGVLASFTAVVLSALGFVLIKMWHPPGDPLNFTAWQLVFGGLALVPLTLVVEGAPPVIDARAVGGFLWIGLVGTLVAYTVWFRGMRTQPAAAVSLVGLLNPVSGIVVGILLAGEVLTPVRALGIALVLGGVLLGQPAVLDAIGRARRPEAEEAAGDAQPKVAQRR